MRITMDNEGLTFANENYIIIAKFDILLYSSNRKNRISTGPTVHFVDAYSLLLLTKRINSYFKTNLVC